MKMISSRNSYEMSIHSYEKHGSEITFKRNFSAGCLTSLMFMILSCVLALYDISATPMNLLIVSLVLTITWVVNTLTKIHSESLIVLASIGVTFKQTSLISSKTRFFDIASIRDIVIVEAITKQSVIFQLVLLPSIKNSCDKNKNIHPLFMSFQPKLEDLKTVYGHIQEKLILPYKRVAET